jgi:undecaprenyl-diphosphatase
MESWLLDIWRHLPGGAPFLAAAALVAYFEGLVVIGLIMPGSTLVVLCGFLAFHGKADITALMLWTGIGALLGDLTSYLLGARWSHLLWNHRLLLRRRELVSKAEIFFIEHGAKSIFFGRFLGPVRGLVPFVAGASRMRPRPFLFYALISALLWGMSYPGLGYLGGTSWQRAQTWVGRLGILVVLLLVVSILVGWLRKHFLGSSRKSKVNLRSEK